MKKLLALPLIALFGCAVANQSPVEGFNNKAMPSFKLVDTAGKTMTNASLKGKVYLVDFWATWCGPCKAAMPTMQKLHNKYKAKGFMVIGTNILERGSDKANIAAQFKKASKLSYVFAKNTPEAEKLADTLKIQGIPTFLLVDKKGVIRHVEVGFSAAHEGDLARRIEALLK
jgi:cytochrome c biogenesis protein CcmG, thiol:disulfide interchange protein DsbE